MSDSKHFREGNVEMEKGKTGKSIKCKGRRENGPKRAS